MNNSEELQSLILAALLHDIGKFYQRTGVELSEEDKRLMPSCCPDYKSKYHHFHVLYSGRFIRETFNNKFPLIENIVLYHHKPDSAPDSYRYLVKILTLADWLSSGERRDRTDIAEAETTKEPLISIFSMLFPDERKIQYKFVPLLPLSFNLTLLFPKDNKSDAINNQSYLSLWKEFTNDLKQLKDETDLNKLIIKFQFLLEKFTLTIPSSAYIDRPDIPLYHHSKTTAGISACIYNLKLEEKAIDEALTAIKDNNDTILNNSPCIPLACDISGIQDFIYSITSEQALKSIKGRSFYL
ncbi:MAG: type III-A CRISPR-associated protein Cas10/Csm1, partial [bacterium]